MTWLGINGQFKKVSPIGRPSIPNCGARPIKLGWTLGFALGISYSWTGTWFMVSLTPLWPVRGTLTKLFLKVETLTHHQNEQICAIFCQNFHHCTVQDLVWKSDYHHFQLYLNLQVDIVILRFWFQLTVYKLGSRRWNWKFREKHFWNPNLELLLQSTAATGR